MAAIETLFAPKIASRDAISLDKHAGLRLKAGVRFRRRVGTAAKPPVNLTQICPLSTFRAVDKFAVKHRALRLYRHIYVRRRR